jgi:hypothetical protein
MIKFQLALEIVGVIGIGVSSAVGMTCLLCGVGPLGNLIGPVASLATTTAGRAAVNKFM